MVRKKTYIHPLFYRPDNVVDFTDDASSVGEAPTLPLTGGYHKTLSNLGVGAGPIVTANVLAAVQNITIVEQIMRTNPDGSHVVDVIIEVDDIPGAATYDIRVTEA